MSVPDNPQNPTPAGPWGQPANGQPPAYGPPQYGQPQYGPPQYGPPGYGMPPANFTPPKRSRKKLWWSIGGGVVAILVVLGVIGAVVGDDSDTKSFGSKKISVPARSGDYVQITGAVADRLVQSARDSLAGSNSGLNASALMIAFYSTGSSATPALTFAGGRLSESGSIGKEKPSNIVDQILLGNGVKDAVTVDAGGLGGLGGVMRCGTTLPRCAWADDSTFGDLVFLKSTSADAQKAAVQFRRDAER